MLRADTGTHCFTVALGQHLLAHTVHTVPSLSHAHAQIWRTNDRDGTPDQLPVHGPFHYSKYPKILTLFNKVQEAR